MNFKEKITPLLDSLEIKSIETACKTFSRVAELEFADGKTNWGRLLTALLFGGLLAKKLQLQGIPLTQNNEDQLSHYITDYIASAKSEWNLENGGWEQGFAKHFERPLYNVKTRIFQVFKDYYTMLWLIAPV
ncbi:bcl-2-related protein A1-like [Rhineura floridana]|uniref:bcl-2-related protein A1-like n=1 Tax=Rhineura floridana TaxID=261503 RepID=UPI002AC8293B|nr:bcl-2-related protein A1-like [Rhineura floridana]